MGPFVEAVRATTQPCTFLLIAPSAIALVCARANWRSLLAALAAAIVGGWLLVANRFVLDGLWLNASGLLVIALLAAIVVPRAAQRWQTWGDPRSHAAVVGIVGLMATLWWRPCVGSELGSILTAGQADLIPELVPMAAYMIGALMPLIVIFLLYLAVDPDDRRSQQLGWLALAVGTVVAGSLALGRHDQVVVALSRWSSG